MLNVISHLDLAYTWVKENPNFASSDRDLTRENISCFLVMLDRYGVIGYSVSRPMSLGLTCDRKRAAPSSSNPRGKRSCTEEPELR